MMTIKNRGPRDAPPSSSFGDPPVSGEQADPEKFTGEFRKIDPASAGAYVIQRDGFRISFNPDTSRGMFGDSDGGPETALVRENWFCSKDGHIWTGEAFFLLKGDFRPEYAQVLNQGGGFWQCKIGVYDRFREKHGSRWSSDFHEWGKDGVERKP